LSIYEVGKIEIVIEKSENGSSDINQDGSTPKVPSNGERPSGIMRELFPETPLYNLLP